MKILVFSDSHGETRWMEKAIREHPDAERIFFLGDGFSDICAMERKFPALPFDIVAGNCDGSLTSASLEGDAPFEKLVDVGGFRFLLTHGHRYAIKSSYQAAADQAIAWEADVLLFGHTHQAEDVTIDGSAGGSVRIINPGSVGARFGASYACLELRGGNLLCGFAECDRKNRRL